MYGAILGDIIGSRFEWNNLKSKNFELFTEDCEFTDDSVMSVAVAKAILSEGNLQENAVYWMQTLGRRYPNSGYGGRFAQWLADDEPKPYHSWGNGAAMRVSACGYAARSMEEATALSEAVTRVTHNHPEGIKGAEATTAAIFLARQGKSKEEIRAYVAEHYYPLNFTLDEIRSTYQFTESCQGTVPQAIEAFLESEGFEDAIRNAISIGGDSDTLGAITGSIAEAYYGIPQSILLQGLTYLDEPLSDILLEFEAKYAKA